MDRAPVLIVTRPRLQAQAWVERLRAKGVEAGAVPLLEILGSAQPDRLAQARLELPEYAVAVFVSPNAAIHFLSPGTPWPLHTWAAAPGHGTARTLMGLGVPADRILQPPPESTQFDSESLWPVMAPLPWAGRRALIVRGDGGREWLSDRLAESGARVDHLSAYRRAPPVLQPEEFELLDRAWHQPEQSLWLFSSSEALNHLPGLLASRLSTGAHEGVAPTSAGPAAKPSAGPAAQHVAGPLEGSAAETIEVLFARWAARAGALATHPRILQQAQALGFTRGVSCRPELEAIVTASAAYNPAHRES